MHVGPQANKSVIKWNRKLPLFSPHGHLFQLFLLASKDTFSNGTAHVIRIRDVVKTPKIFTPVLHL